MSLRNWLKRQPKLRLAALAIVLLAGTISWAAGLEALVRARLDPNGATAPTRLYARPLMVRAGTTVDHDRVERQLRRLGYREGRGHTVGIGEYRLDSWVWSIGRRPFRLADRLDPGGVSELELGWDDEVVAIRDAAGRSLPHLVLEPEVLRTVQGADHADRIPVKLEEVPAQLVEAILTVEDQRFFRHGGLDLRRVVGATLANLKGARITQGASTITQQLARTRWLTRRRTPWRKLREMALAQALEARHTKDEILEAYLNEVYLGQDGAFAIRGVGRAAEFYFAKDVTQLDLSESALVAGIIRGPNLYAPFREPEMAKQRRDLVLDLMLQRELLTEAAHRSAKRMGLRLQRRPEPRRTGRYFTDWVLQDLAAKPGLAVFTTLDPELQRLAEEVVHQELRRLERAHRSLARADQPLQAALVALDPWSGEILAMVGGRDYAASQFNRAVHARRQPGSAFKPIVALAALTHGEAPFTLVSELENEPLEVETPAGWWRPVNYDSSFGGNVTLRDALERSLNVPFARLGLAVGAQRIAQTAQHLGIESPLQPVPSLALGASDLTLLELTRAFAVFAAYGYRADPVATLGVLDASGRLIAQADLRGEQVVSPAAAYVVTSALEGAVERGTGRGVRRFYDGPVAAKSGTTNDHRDAWFVGYTPRLAVGVWVGFDDGKSVGLPGAAAALPIFARFLEGAAREHEGEFPVPDGVEFVDAGPECRTEVFLAGTAPEHGCTPYWTPWRPVADGVRSLIAGLRRLFGGGH